VPADGAAPLTVTSVPTPYSPLEDVGLGILDPRSGGGHREHEPHPDGEAQRDEDRLPQAAAQLPREIDEEEHAVVSRATAVARR